MNSQTKLNNSFATRSFLSLIGGIVIAQAGMKMGRAFSDTVNWYFIALCLIYLIVPVAILRAIRRSPDFSRRPYAVTLNVAALLAVVVGAAFGFRLI